MSNDIGTSPRPVPEKTLSTWMFEVLEALRSRWPLALVVLILAVSYGGHRAMRPRLYQSQATLRVQPGLSSMYKSNPLSMLSGQAEDKIASEVTILQSRTLFLKVAHDLNLVSDKGFWSGKLPKVRSLDDPLTREELLLMMSKSIRVSHNPRDEILRITCETSSPELSASIINTLINEYIIDLFKMRYGATERTSSWLLGQLNDLKQQVEQDQTTLVRMRGDLGLVGFDEKSDSYLLANSIDALNKAATTSTMERIVAEAKLRMLEESDPNLIEGEVNLLNNGTPPAGQNSLLANLRNSRAQVAGDYARLLALYGANYPEVREQKAHLDELNNEVRTEEQRILNQTKISYQAAQTNENMSKRELEQKKKEAFSSRNDMVKYLILLHDYDAHRTLYETLVARLREVSITSGIEAAEVDVVDVADVPAEPSSPSPFLVVAEWLTIGLLLVAILGTLLNAMDHTIKTAQEATRVSGVPLLSVVPHVTIGTKVPRETNEPIFVLSDPKSVYAESIQTLRTAVLLAKPGRPPKVILLSSTLPAEGKSTTTINLAATFARHHARSLIIECDLRRVTLRTRLNLTGKHGVTSVLTGQVTLEEAIQPYPGNEYLHILTAGHIPPDPAVMIASQEMKQLVEQAAKLYDFVFIDCPPILGLSDVLNLGPLADAMLLVVRMNKSSARSVAQAKRMLDSVNLVPVGFIFNDVSTSAFGYEYGYGYSYGYSRYGYGTKEVAPKGD